MFERDKFRTLRYNEQRALRRLEKSRRLKTSKTRKLWEVVKLLESRKGCDHDTTRKLLEDIGCKLVWRRFVLAGGVGTFYWLERKKIYRIQAFAAVCGMNPNRATPPRARKKYFRYAWCVEI